MANDSTRRVQPRDASPDTGGQRRVPPLIWIVLAVLVAWFAVAMWQRQGTHPTASGRETVTSPTASPAYTPPAPGSGAAPATPASNAPAPH